MPDSRSPTEDRHHNPGTAPADPRSDPEEKLGRRPDAATLAEEARLQKSGAAARSSERNANLPSPSDPARENARDPDAEHRLPGK